MNEKREVTELRKQNKRMKKALEFYADTKNYGHDGEPVTPGGFYELDMGKTAREALATPNMIVTGGRSADTTE